MCTLLCVSALHLDSSISELRFSRSLIKSSDFHCFATVKHLKNNALISRPLITNNWFQPKQLSALAIIPFVHLKYRSDQFHNHRSIFAEKSFKNLDYFSQ
ncbi:Ubiquinone biosynthesis O-methyltransferase [Trichinella pseudospiralis]